MNIKSGFILVFILLGLQLNVNAEEQIEMPESSICWDHPELSFCANNEISKLKYQLCIDQCDFEKSLCFAKETDPLAEVQDYSICHEEYQACTASCEELKNTIIDL